jgi:nucleotide-binding universal stress UspA family protein
MLQHVLVPVDHSTQARKALAFALDEYPEAEITVLHVISPTAVVAVSDPAVWDDRLLERKQEEAEELLTEMQDEAKDRGVDVRTELVYGRTPQSIIEYAGESDASGIVIGSHGRTGFSRVVLGSVAETVVRRSPVPVTVVR